MYLSCIYLSAVFIIYSSVRPSTSLSPVGRRDLPPPYLCVTHLFHGSCYRSPPLATPAGPAGGCRGSGDRSRARSILVTPDSAQCPALHGGVSVATGGLCVTRARLACGFSMSHPGQNRESVPLGRDLCHQTQPPSGVLASGFHIQISGCSGGRGAPSSL